MGLAEREPGGFTVAGPATARKDVYGDGREHYGMTVTEHMNVHRVIDAARGLDHRQARLRRCV